MNIGHLPSDPVTRRRLLGTAGSIVAGALALGASASPPGPRRTVASAFPRPAGPAGASHKPKPKPRPLPTLNRPVFTLTDYRKVVTGPAFPGHAVALTIDDGPHPVWTPKILRLLEKHHVPALFCMIGNQIRGHEATARDVVRDGHHIANHTWSHPLRLSKKSHRTLDRELTRGQETIHDTTGQTPTLFRSPGGDWGTSLLKSAAAHQLVPLDWNNDPRDWTRPGTDAITHRMLTARPGQILLCHDGGGDRSQTYAALKAVIPQLKARGLHFVALDGRPSPKPAA
ncbi:polysaccharide deacetylase family protein [Actinoplanes sp. NPDC051494]|uniref:polysaccharide deacetylase family protein n=1 Tax=Actinoplanes sp. NPDC051494 TaxID=3363907 RepID=UPI003799D050